MVSYRSRKFKRNWKIRHLSVCYTQMERSCKALPDREAPKAIGLIQPPANWCLPRSGLGFPFGEAGTQIGTSEPIWVTEEVFQGFNIPGRLVKRRSFRLFAPILVHSKLQLFPNLFRPSARTYGTFPKGEGKALRAVKLQTTIFAS